MEYVSSDNLVDLKNRLTKARDAGVNTIDETALKELLQSAFEAYNSAHGLMRQAFSTPWLLKTVPNIQNLPATPFSIELENIATSWRGFLAGNFEPWRFWLSVLWSIALDLAAFVIFYFGVLPKD